MEVLNKVKNLKTADTKTFLSWEFNTLKDSKRDVTKKGDDIVLDLFLGSGSTLIASEKTGRICYGMELDPKYIDVIIQRYVDYVDSPKVIKNGIDETHLWKKKTK